MPLDLDFWTTNIRKVILLSSILNSSSLSSPTSEISCCPICELMNLYFPLGAVWLRRTTLEVYNSCSVTRPQAHLPEWNGNLYSGAGRAGSKRFELVKVQGLFRIYCCLVKCVAAFHSMMAVYLLIFQKSFQYCGLSIMEVWAVESWPQNRCN